jgi:hypothetical protein
LSNPAHLSFERRSFRVEIGRLRHRIDVERRFVLQVDSLVHPRQRCFGRFLDSLLVVGGNVRVIRQIL